MNRGAEIHLHGTGGAITKALEQLRRGDYFVLGIDGGGGDDMFVFYVLGAAPKCVFLLMTTTPSE